MPYEPLHHKYRPQTFAQLVGQAAIATTLSSAIAQQRIAPAYLFTGARGTGKTSSARILAKSLNCLQNSTPTAQPCGVCEVCRAIANGSALDVIEIDAASNTGVDNIRELIERAQFAPVQCRYKVYVVDECLTGDSLVLTQEGLTRIDDPTLQGKKVLSYNDTSGAWEFKSVLRWLDQGERQTFIIKTANREIRCTGNHLIRTEQGWIAAKDISAGVKILSPASVDATHPFVSSGQTEEFDDLPEDINSKAIPLGKKSTIWSRSSSKLSHINLSVLVGVVRAWISLITCSVKEEGSKVFKPTGNDILTERITAFGSAEQKSFWPMQRAYRLKRWDLFTAPYWEMEPLLTLTNTVAILGLPGLMPLSSKSGWNLKPHVSQPYALDCGTLQIKAMESSLPAVIQPVIPSLQVFSGWSNQTESKSKFLLPGLLRLVQKGWLGGTWTMVHSVSVQKEAHKSSFILKATLLQKIVSWLIGLQKWVTQPGQDVTQGQLTRKHTTTSGWEPKPLENGYQTCSSTQFQQWSTNLETVESVHPGGVERVYDIEVEDNHNFVANGLLVHNCHMLSTAAFNALLKTLEEPPDRVVFVLATTDPQRVLPTIISRCQRFDFRRIPLEDMVQHLRAIAAQEQITITPEAVQLVAQISQGGLRDAESLLDQLSLLDGEITVERVWDLVGAVPERDLMALLEAIAQNDPATVLDRVRHLMNRGREPLIVLQNLASFYRDLLIAKTARDRSDLVAMTAETWTQLCEFAQGLNISLILAGQQHLRACEVQIKNTTQPRLWLEVTLLGLLPSALSTSVLETSQREQARAIPSQAPVGISGGFAASPAPGHNGTASAQTPPVPVAPPPPVEPNGPVVAPPTPQPQIPQPAAIAQAQATPDPSPVSPSPNSSPESTPGSAPAIAPTPAPVSAPAVDHSIEQNWQKVMNQIQPYSTQVLVRQQCRLLSMQGAEARIGIASQPLFKMAQSKLPNIEAAFQVVFGRKIRVSLEIIMPTEANPAEAPAPSPPEIPSAYPALTPAPPIPDAPPSLPPPTWEGQPPSNGNGSHPPVSLPPTPLPPVIPVVPLPVSLEPTSLAPMPWQDDDEVTKAAKRLAEFFGGRVIDLEDTLETAAPLSAQALPANALEDPEPEPEGEELPF